MSYVKRTQFDVFDGIYGEYMDSILSGNLINDIVSNLGSGLKCIPTSIAGVYIIERTQRHDARGMFERLYCQETMKHLGWQSGIAQMNHSYTKQVGTVRGMHYQIPPFAEYKLVSCIRGVVWDVVVDVRQDSATFLQHVAMHLSAENVLALLIPPGCAHGFQTLSDDVDLLYCHSAAYSQQHEAGLNASDPQLNILWPLPIQVQSERDVAFTHINCEDHQFKGIVL